MSHELPPLRFVGAAEFIAMPREGAEALAGDSDGDAVIPAGGFALVYGDGGAGKTTLVLDLVVHLATQTPWLNLVTPTRAVRCAVIENEGPLPMFHRKLARKLAAWPEAAPNIIVLEQPWQGVTLREETHREQLADAISEHAIDLLVAGPLSRLGMQGGGTLDETAEFAAFVADVQARCSRPPAVMLVHHQNRSGQVSGAWEGAPDTLLHVQGRGHGHVRIHWQKCRWAAGLHGTSTYLSWAANEGFTVEAREEVSEDTMADEIRAAVRQHPGGSWRKIRDRVRGNATESAAVRDRLIDAGEIVNRPAREGTFSLWSADDPGAGGSDLRTAIEPPRLPFPEEGREGDRFPVPGHKEPGNRNRTPEPGDSGADDHSAPRRDS